MVHTLFAEGLVRPGRLEEHLNGLETVRALARRSRLRPSRPSAASRRRRFARSRAIWPPRRAPPSTGASAPARRSSARSRAGWWTSSTSSPATSTAWAARSSPSGGWRAQHDWRPWQGRGMRFGEKNSRVRGAPQVAGELPVAVLAEEIETPGAGQVRALITIARQSRPQRAQWRPAGRRARHAGVHGQRGRLPQRDDAPRRRHPAAALAAGARALRPRVLPALRAQHRPLLARRSSRAQPISRRSGRCCCA